MMMAPVDDVVGVGDRSGGAEDGDERVRRIYREELQACEERIAARLDELDEPFVPYDPALSSEIDSAIDDLRDLVEPGWRDEGDLDG
jgi:hypothetical protein